MNCVRRAQLRGASRDEFFIFIYVDTSHSCLNGGPRHKGPGAAILSSGVVLSSSRLWKPRGAHAGTDSQTFGQFPFILMAFEKLPVVTAKVRIPGGEHAEGVSEASVQP